MASKIDTAAQKAYEEAAAKKAAVTKEAKAETTPVVAKAKEEKKPAPAKKVKKAPARKTAAKKVAAKAKPAAKKKAAVAKKAAAKKTKTVKKAAPRKTKAAAPKPKKSIAKETVMTKAKETATDYTTQVKEGIAELQSRAKTAYDKGTEFASEMGEFSKGNVEAVVESGKILAAGAQDIAKGYVEDSKSVVETVTADVKEVAAVRSPTELVQLQGKIASRNFDAAVAAVSKNTEAWLKLANEAFTPLSSRASLAMEKIRKAA